AEDQILETYIHNLPAPPSPLIEPYLRDDEQLQLGLLVDGSVVTRSVYAADWRDVWEELLGKVPETIYRARIDLNWLRTNFGGLDNDSTEVQREQQARVYILRIIGGLLMLDKSQNLFKWMPYSDPAIQECIRSEFLMNPNNWHVNVSLVVHAIVEIHESDRVLQQFGFRQSISLTPQDTEDLHHIDLLGRTNKHWPTFHAQYINIWNN
ncbi:hypothetical protein Golob_005641, partial [Gossypium lobatum]|nr:hypothetical protein [Gossypium lobatum]